MPVSPNGTTLTLSGTCGAEDAETVLGWCLSTPGGTVDLQHCDHLHMAVLQVLMIAERPVHPLPEAPTLRRCVEIALRQSTVSQAAAEAVAA